MSKDARDQGGSDRNDGTTDQDEKVDQRHAPTVVGPTDVADDVKALLRRAFESNPASRGWSDRSTRDRTPSFPIKRESAVREQEFFEEIVHEPTPPSLVQHDPEPANWAHELFGDDVVEDDMDQTGVFDVEAFHPEEPVTLPKKSFRRRLLSLISPTRKSTDTPSEKDGEPSDGGEEESPFEWKVDAAGNKRVVISDDDVESIVSVEPEIGRERKKKRPRVDAGVGRDQKRRWRTRTVDGRWKLRWYTVVGIVLGAIVAVFFLLTSPLLSIKSIVVEGNSYTDPTRLDDILSDLEGDPILTADLHGATRKIEAISWVRKVRISMHLPSRIVVQIDERTPLAFFLGSDGFIRVVDRYGRVLDVIEGDPTDYVRIIGPGPSLALGDFVPQPFLGVVDLVDSLPMDLRDRLISATVSPEGEISLQLRPNLQVIFGQPSDFQVKLVAVVNEMKRQGNRSYTLIDVSTGEANVR